MDSTEDNENLQDIGRHVRSQVIILGGIILFLWVLEMIDWAIGGYFDQFGIIPREVIGLRGIVAAPFLHGGFSHLAANTLPLLILGWFVLLQGIRPFVIVSIIVIFVGGLGTWLIAPTASLHIGASGLIFGFFGFLLLRGYFERSWQSIFWSIAVLLLYGGMLWGILPGTPAVSWQMHLFGFIGGGLAAYLITKNGAKPARNDSGERSIESEIRFP